MKKLLALVALVAMVAVASVSYAASDNVVMNASITSTVSITGCTSVDFIVTPTTKPSDTCVVTLASNDTNGYSIDYSDTDADTDLDSVSTGGAIETLLTGGTSCAAGADCSSWYISTLNDGTAQTDSDNGGGLFNAGEHSVEALADVENIIDSTNQYAGTFTTTYYVTVGTTTEEAADYTNTTVYTITAA